MNRTHRTLYPYTVTRNKPGRSRQPAGFENFPGWMVVVCNANGLAIYVTGFVLMLQTGLLLGLLYAAYCLWMEWRLLSDSCTACYYYGKRCGFGKGRVCAWFFPRKTEKNLCNIHITWQDLIPDFMVMLIPVGFGIGNILHDFSWLTLSLIAIMLLLSTAGTSLVRGKLACKYCKQRQLGCQAEQLFSKHHAT